MISRLTSKPMRVVAALAFVVVVAAVAGLAGCSSSTSSGSGPAGSPTPVVSAPAPLSDDEIVNGDFPEPSEYANVGNGTTQGLAATNVNVAFTASGNKRTVLYATPKGDPPADGWPVILEYFFVLPETNPVDYFTITTIDECSSSGDSFDCGYRLRNIMYKQLLDAGFAIVSMGTWQGDISWNSWFFSPDPNDKLKTCCCSTECASAEQAREDCEAYWPGTDEAFLGPLFDDMHDGKYGKLDMANVALGGYSAGAQAVSRAINNYPSMTTPAGNEFPGIRSAMMLSGGSYFCYGDATVSWCKNPIGCCPQNQTEQIYDDGQRPWSEHPPVILAQTTNDDYADTNASVYYFDVLKSHDVPTELVRQDLDASVCEKFYGKTGKCETHTFFPKMINPVVDFYVRFAT